MTINTINGAVDLSTLTAEQKTILDWLNCMTAEEVRVMSLSDVVEITRRSYTANNLSVPTEQEILHVCAVYEKLFDYEFQVENAVQRYQYSLSEVIKTNSKEGLK